LPSPSQFHLKQCLVLRVVTCPLGFSQLTVIVELALRINLAEN